MSIRILVGSQNPVKIDSVREAFSRYFQDVEVVGVEVDSGVPSQPFGEETFVGAHNRAQELLKINKERSLGAFFFVGLEGGVTKHFDHWFSFGSVCIMDADGKEGFGLSPHYEIPNQVIDELKNGAELGDVTARITGDPNARQKGGILAYLTQGVMDRKDLYVPGVVVALVPFLNEDFFEGKQLAEATIITPEKR